MKGGCRPSIWQRKDQHAAKMGEAMGTGLITSEKGWRFELSIFHKCLISRDSYLLYKPYHFIGAWESLRNDSQEMILRLRSQGTLYIANVII